MPNDENEGLPPFFKTWKQMYASLLVYLVALIGLFYWLSAVFR